MSAFNPFTCRLSVFKHRLATAVLRASACLPLACSRGLGYLLGQYLARSDSAAGRVTRENLQLCFPQLPPAELEALARASLIETARAMLETGAVWLRDYRWVERRIVAVEGLELAQAALADARGLIILAPHLGNWEVLGLYLSTLGPITSLYQPPENPALEQIVRHSREKVGATLVPTNRQGVMALLKTLKNGGFTAILPDQVPEPSGGAFAPFFGVPALTMTLVHNLVQRTHCQVLMAYARRVPGGFVIVFCPAAAGIGGADEQCSLAQLNSSIEACVRAVPAQYQWEYKRFKKQPPGAARVYAKHGYKKPGG
jgi:KDO2-lipid IV(A) lauroyltransferase